MNRNTADGLFTKPLYLISLIYNCILQSLNKAYQPKVKHLVPSTHGYAHLNDVTSQASMRLTRSDPNPGQGPAVSVGQYFEGISDVISRDGCALIADATAKKLEKDVSLNDIKEVLIRSEKHGSDYHPARIEVVLDDQCASFVMNVAITARGKARLCREFEVLRCLSSKYDYPFLPRTYFQGETSPPSMLMFLADWFQGYYEFHLQIDKEDGSQRLVLWNTEKGHYRLSEPQVRQVYYQSARILTLYYDLETFEQIFPWHHAAGDFVVKAQGESMDVRLITARQYAPMLESSEKLSIQEALLLFLLNMFIRMRLDRLDGMGSVAWADDDCVDPTLEGFVAGLRTKERQGTIETGFVDGFLSYLRSLAIVDISYGLNALVDACDQAAPDIPIIRDHIESHILKFHSALQSLKN